MNYGIRGVQKKELTFGVGFLARLFVSFVSHIVRYAFFSTDKSSSLSIQKLLSPVYRTIL